MILSNLSHKIDDAPINDAYCRLTRVRPLGVDWWGDNKIGNHTIGNICLDITNLVRGNE